MYWIILVYLPGCPSIYLPIAILSYSIIFYPSITSSFHLSLYLSIDPSISFSISIIIHLYSSVMICRHLCASASLSLSLFVIYIINIIIYIIYISLSFDVSIIIYHLSIITSIYLESESAKRHRCCHVCIPSHCERLAPFDVDSIRSFEGSVVKGPPSLSWALHGRGKCNP